MTTAIKKVKDTLSAAQECSGCGRIFRVCYQTDGSYLYESEEDCGCETDFHPADETIPSISEWLIRLSELPVLEPSDVTDNTITYTHTVTISQVEVNRLQGYLSREEGCVPGGHDTLADYSAKFNTEQGRFGVEIKVCNANTPYMDAVLYKIDTLRDQDAWSEIGTLEVSETFLGERRFEINRDGKMLVFLVNVEVANEDKEKIK